MARETATARQNGIEVAPHAISDTEIDVTTTENEDSADETAGLVTKHSTTSSHLYDISPALSRGAGLFDRSKFQKLLVKYFLPIGFAAALVISIVWPFPGKQLADLKVGGFGVLQAICVCIMFLVSGLCFNTSDIKGAIHAFQGVIFGILSILIFTPLSGFAIMKLSLIPHHFRVGLSVFVSVPTTLTIGVALVEQAGGNSALALLLTVVTNIFGILTVPFAVRWTVGSSSNASIDAQALLIKLLVTILVPLAIGKALLELSSRVRSGVAAHKTAMSLIKNGACVTIVWLSMSHSRKDLVNQEPLEMVLLLVFTSLLHISFLVFNSSCCWLIGVRQRELLAVVIMASQKTFAVSLAVISYLDPDRVGDLGLLTIPCILAHMVQLFMDSFLLSKWNYDHLENEQTNSV